MLINVDDVALGHMTKMHWNDSEHWITSAQPIHKPLITEEQFAVVQATFGTRKTGSIRTPTQARRYVLAGLMRCAVCGRRMQGNWNHGRAYYRCKFPDDYPAGDHSHPRNVYVKEEAILPGLDGWLASLFDDEHLDDTCARLAGVSEPDPTAQRREAALRAAIADCDRKLANYRALLDHQDAVPVAAAWIADTQRERKNLERQLGTAVAGDSLSSEQVKALVSSLREIVQVLAAAEPVDKAEIYAPTRHFPRVRSRRHRDRRVATAWVHRLCRRGDLNPHPLTWTSPSS